MREACQKSIKKKRGIIRVVMKKSNLTLLNKNKRGDGLFGFEPTKPTILGKPLVIKLFFY